jgi:PAS domain S-box-containing protein
VAANAAATAAWPALAVAGGPAPLLYTPGGEPLAWAATPAAEVMAGGPPHTDLPLMQARPDLPPQPVYVTTRPIARDGAPVGVVLTLRPAPAAPPLPADAPEYERLSAVIADLQITLAVHDNEGRIVLVNETWLRRTGLKREQVLGRRLPDIMPHPFFRFAQELVERVLRSGHAETIRDHYLMMRHDRPGGYIDGSVVPIRGPDGTFVGVVSATTDVTSKVLARHAVEAAHARLARILEHLPVGVFLVESERDGPPRWTLVNSTGQDYVWRGPGPIEDTGPVTVLDSEGTAYPPGESPLAQPRWTGPPPPPQEIVLRYPDGNDRVLLTTAAVVQSSLAHREAVIVAQDITDLKQAEAALRRSEERFVKAFRASPDGISITRVGDGRILDVNDRWAELAGYTRDELIGKTTVEINVWENPADRQWMVEQLRAHGSVRDFEMRFRTSGGAVRDASLSAELLSLDDQPCLLVIVHDITDRKQRQAQLADQMAQVTTVHAELAAAYDTTLEGWSRALDLRDRETEGHSRRVTEITLLLAEALGVPPDERVHIRRGALLHDIGKMGIPDSILHKPGPLTPDEWMVMRLHPLYAYELLEPIPFLRPALDSPYCHHERWDGTGYPRGLAGTAIPRAARIFAVVDIWDGLSSDRPYRAAWPPERVLAYIADLAGTHLDPAVVPAFLDLIADLPPDELF